MDRLRSLILSFILAPHLLAQQSDRTTALLRYPDLHGNSVVFTYAGDLWTAAADGGEARKLTTHPGYEYLPKFSPDGHWIAFSAEYDGNMDVYVMPSSGGEPKRLTFHPLFDRVLGWTRDGRILFRSRRRSTSVQGLDGLFIVGVEGGMPEELPLPGSGPASFSPDGKKIAYNRVSGEGRFWKRYRGGTQSYVSMFDLQTHAYDEVPHGDAGDLFPMWYGGAIYFVSDRDGVMNLYRFDVVSRDVRQLTRGREYDIKWPSLASDGSPRIIYECGGLLYRFDIEKETAELIPIHVSTDAPQTRPTVVKVDKLINALSLSPSGARALVGARGEIFSVPVKEGEVRNLTNSSGVRELWPSWSPDGRWIAYASDHTGEYELYVRPQQGGEEKKLTTLGPGFRSGLAWSPDSSRILFADSSLALFHVDVNGGTPVLVDRSEYGPIEGYDWSPDGRWIVYARLGANQLHQIFVQSVAESKSYPVTTEMTDDTSPVFDRDGKYLYFLSRRIFKPRFSDFEKSFNFNDSMGIYLIPLRSDLRSPFVPTPDEEKPSGPAARLPPGVKPGEHGKPGTGAGIATASEQPQAVAPETPKRESAGDGVFRIDLLDISSRVLPIAVETGDYTALLASKGRVFYLLTPMDGGEPAANKTLKTFDIIAGEEKTLIEGIGSYDLNRAGDKIVYRAGSKIGIIDATKSAKVGDGALDLTHLEMRLDPRAEWKQIFDEAWRMERDSFYDPTMRGIDWVAMKKRYEKELPYVALRSDLNYLIGEMNGELGVSHLNASGGDAPEIRRQTVGLLGADYEVAGGRYRFRRIYRGDNSANETRSPLTAPGARVEQGEYLLAVNGHPLRAGEELYRLFEGTAGKSITLLVNDKPDEKGAREVVVAPIENEGEIRYLDWVEMNRKKVLAATNGNCAYIHLPDTQDRGITAFGRAFYAQTDKRCLLLDARWNSGGYIPDFFFERLARRHLEFDAPRHGADAEYQRPAIDGPKVLVINEYAGSGGDSVADYFRKYALGPIVGKRTWGGLMGIGDELPMIDGGTVTVPNVSAWDIVDGKSIWIVENRGVSPDIEVDNRPDLLIEGRDPQLEKGIELLKEDLAKHPYSPPVRPPYGRN
jgi:tricorn protease